MLAVKARRMQFIGQVTTLERVKRIVAEDIVLIPWLQQNKATLAGNVLNMKIKSVTVSKSVQTMHAKT
jgi:hypothetical protein